ncbi:MAG: dioxygenase [Nitrososphaera sp.]|uniref:dioxygenase family protein n=1 Tax=Nitrososphaera sp. TaxID=1971748 RepID=UPI003D6E1A07
MKKAPIAIGAAAAIAVAIFVAISAGQRPAPDFKCSPTENNIEGPYYRPGAPAWQVPADMPGVRLAITGKVVDHNCEPVPGAVLDFWQTDSKGEYDNSGYVLRGTIMTGEDGSYKLDTIQPGKYETRPAHIHVKVWDKGQELLTTQLYIIENDKDEFVRDSLIIEPQGQGGNRTASFDFVVIR